MATLMLQPQEEVIEALFHDYTPAGQFAFRPGDLVVYFMLYFFISAYTFGVSVPAGLFVPAILCGSAFGRLVGEAVQDWAEDDSIRPGTYALIGATAMLGGVTRMTISLTVILLETTNNIKYLLPIMIVLMIAKFVGDCFNISLYDMHVELNALPFVESHPPQDLSKLCASDVMSKPVVTLPLKPSHKDVRKTLTSTSHNGFPVVDEDGHFLGMILRNQLVLLLNRDCFWNGTKNVNEPNFFDFCNTLHSKITLLRDPKSASSTKNDDDQKHVMNLSRFLNPAPVTVQTVTRLSRVYQLYRSMGIRHMPVVDKKNRVVGMLTRQELHTDFSLDLF